MPSKKADKCDNGDRNLHKINKNKDSCAKSCGVQAPGPKYNLRAVVGYKDHCHSKWREPAYTIGQIVPARRSCVGPGPAKYMIKPPGYSRLHLSESSTQSSQELQSGTEIRLTRLLGAGVLDRAEAQEPLPATDLRTLRSTDISTRTVIRIRRQAQGQAVPVQSADPRSRPALSRLPVPAQVQHRHAAQVEAPLRRTRTGQVLPAAPAMLQEAGLHLRRQVSRVRETAQGRVRRPVLRRRD
ncbi:unnamed protein product [Trichogramma brassicae]|uniref:Uncharacterized protein n=1 Tax=Trichogramma brassicae TaxID=86971 RepID=A0A6H5IV78_9HYME|nr:unnamed protein product [Trichogramma brassicae]